MRQTQKHNKKVINKINSRNNNTKNLINKKTKQQKNIFLHRSTTRNQYSSAPSFNDKKDCYKRLFKEIKKNKQIQRVI